MFRILLVCAVFGMLLTSAAQAANEFRCDTEVFVGTEKKPVQQSLTIFTGTFAYDFLLGAPEEITVYDVDHGKITLLDRSRKLKTTINTDDLLQFTAARKTIPAESELFKFCTKPLFEETFTDDTLTLAAKQLSYSVICMKPEQSGTERRYREFADWSARLNGMRPGNLPPFPRLELNRALVKQGMLPKEIERTISTTHLTGKRTETVRSQHRFNWALNTQDRTKVEQVGDYLKDFKPALVEDYLGMNQVKKTAMK